jgi:flagellar L-ring protein precursor FlgH
MIQKSTNQSVLALTLLLFVFSAMSLNVKAESSGDKKKKKDKQATTKPITEALTPAPPASPAPTPVPPANGSLFSEGAAATSLVTDFKPQRVGDLVFIDVVETSTATVSSTANRSRDSGTVGGLVGAVAAIPSPAAAAVSAVIGGLGQRKFDGKGSTGRQSVLKARITARVVEVLPNGDLRIEANKLVKINKEDESLSLSGIVRTRDVSADNAVASTAVGDLKIALNGKGVASADNQPGWLFRLIDKVSPF